MSPYYGLVWISVSNEVRYGMFDSYDTYPIPIKVPTRNPWDLTKLRLAMKYEGVVLFLSMASIFFIFESYIADNVVFPLGFILASRHIDKYLSGHSSNTIAAGLTRSIVSCTSLADAGAP